MKNKPVGKEIKAGIWYTISNFLGRGIVYLVTPIFTRLLTKEQFGEFTNFTSWISVLLVIITLDLYTSINRAYFDFKNEFDKFISTIAIISIAFTIIIYTIVNFYSGYFISLFKMNLEYIQLMFLYLLFFPAYSFFQNQQRIKGKYKLFSIISVFNSIATTTFSILLVIYMRDKLLGRVVGYVLPVLIVNFIIYAFIFYKGRGMRWKFAVYAIQISVPLIPHHLASNVLATSDRLMIMNYCGAGDMALYSLAYTCSTMVTLLHTSINQALVPWLYNNMHTSNLKIIRQNTKIIITAFLYGIIGILLFTPEILLVFGGENYFSAIWVMPPVIIGCCYQFAYTLYVNIEFYEKKTMSVSIGTVFAAIINIILNMVFIPRYGYIAAAYTTLIGYIFLFTFHFIAVRFIIGKELYDDKFIWKIMLASLLLIIVIYLLYLNIFLRYIFILLYIFGVVIITIKRDKVIKMFSIW